MQAVRLAPFDLQVCSSIVPPLDELCCVARAQIADFNSKRRNQALPSLPPPHQATFALSYLRTSCKRQGEGD